MDMQQFPVGKSTVDLRVGDYPANRQKWEAVLAEFDQKLKQVSSEGTRDRIALLLDSGSPFLELGAFAGFEIEGSNRCANLIAGIGLVSGRICLIMSHIPTQSGGSWNEMTVIKVNRIMEIGMENDLPLISLVQSAGVFLPQQFRVFHKGGQLFRDLAIRSQQGKPSCAIVFGSSTAGGAYHPALSDYTIFVENQAQVFLGGPPLVKMATGEIIEAEELGGASIHATVTGLADQIALDEFDAIQKGREWVSMLRPPKSSASQLCPSISPRYHVDDILSLINPDIRKPFDMREVLLRIVDDSRILSFKPKFGPNLMTSWNTSWHCGQPNPRNPSKRSSQGGPIHPNVQPRVSIKIPDIPVLLGFATDLYGARNVPILFLHNVTGFMVGSKAEHAGIIKAGAQLVSAVSCSKVPHISIILGASYGAGNYAMCGRSYRPRFLFTWPIGRCSVMGPDQVAGVMETIKAKSSSASKRSPEEAKAQGEKLRREAQRDAECYSTSAVLHDDGVIDPRDTRDVIDQLSRHIEDADEAIYIGSVEESAVNPFLDMELLIKTAIHSDAQAIHPGYGYLSENSQFADNVRQAGLIFVGPSGEAMSTLGDKRSSKEYLRARAPDVPLIPGFSGASQEVSDLEAAAEKIGVPVMVKASSGGGGKGMRIVREVSELRNELLRAQSEAQRSFGSSDCILEKFIENSKHVEIQIVGDQHGDVVSFFERDCSVQRRNQKVIEETPCSFLDDDTRRKMGETAVQIVKLIGYEGAGTVEFVLDTHTMKYYFLEVNTRLQVEHPITEEVVGVDLVALQIFVAAGGRLCEVPELTSLKQSGHAIECRLCAEDPQRNFFPTNDRILLWQPGKPGRSDGSVVRYETAIQTGALISIHFDSMICKIVVWAPTRALAIDRMVSELAQIACIGIRTNQLFLQSCLVHPKFRDPRYTTSFIADNLASLLLNPYASSVSSAVALIPSLYLKAVRKEKSRRLPNMAFKGIRQRFYNQRHDPFAVDSEILTWKLNDFEMAVCLLQLPVNDDEHSHDAFYISELPTERSQVDQEASPNLRLPATSRSLSQFKHISQSLRTGKVWQGPTYRGSLLALNTSNEDGKVEQSKWSSTSVIDVLIDGKKLRAFIAVPRGKTTTHRPLADETDRVLCHIPELGDWVEFHRHTLLSYSTSQRKAEGPAAGKDQKHVNAPMPCKILTILKSPGEEINKGDSVMVIESMKMEITISIEASGKFQTPWKVGDAVNEGLELCSVS
ncbi:hypothetical protein G7046_g2583 [Stylonectria norvegica]|nr:hypothetical protein G7046_g2583 [Stylonectria norvegica]